MQDLWSQGISVATQTRKSSEITLLIPFGDQQMKVMAPLFIIILE